jgi:hypothetical protein
MLDTEITRKISEFVRTKPRSIQEIAIHIKKNWRTTDRYIEKIKDETGIISVRIFREGTRGALKIVFWNALEDIHSMSFQDEIAEKILRVSSVHEFSPFDIYQHLDPKKKKVYVEEIKSIDPEIEISNEQDLVGLLRQATKQVLFFSGNISWINSHQGKTQIINVIRELVKKGIVIKVIGRVSLVGSDNVRKLLSINKEFGKEVIELKHRYQPIRAIIVDNKVVKFREIKDPAYYPPTELNKMIEIFYEIYDKEWIEWLQKVFWKMFSTGIPAEKRLKEIDNITKKIF